MLVRSMVIFLGVTFAISWGLPALYVLVFPDVQNALSGYAAVSFVSFFGPAVGGIAAAASCGRDALQRHFGFLSRVSVGWHWYVGTVTTIIAAYAGVVVISHAAGSPPLYGLWNYWTLLLFLPPPFSDAGAIEELGFRGWLLPLMQHNFPPYVAAFVVGVFWFLFHYSVLLPGFPFGTPQLPNWDRVALFFVQIVALSFIFTILFNATSGSIPLVFVAHWLINIAIKLCLCSSLAVWPSVIALVAIVVIVLGRRYLTDEYKVVAP